MRKVKGYVCIATTKSPVKLVVFGPNNNGRSDNPEYSNIALNGIEAYKRIREARIGQAFLSIRVRDFSEIRLARLEMEIAGLREEETLRRKRSIVLIGHLSEGLGVEILGPYIPGSWQVFDRCSPIEDNRLTTFNNRTKTDWEKINWARDEARRQSRGLYELASFKIKLL